MRNNCLEKDIWMKTDDTQWVKYLSSSDKEDHYFKVVDCITIPDDDNPYCIFSVMKVLINITDLNNGYYDEYINMFYNSIEDIKDEYGEVDLQLLAEMIAETDMFSGQADDCENILKFELDSKADNLKEEVISKCNEVEEYIKKYL